MPETLHNVEKEMDADNELNLEIIRQNSMVGRRTESLRGRKMKYERIKYL